MELNREICDKIFAKDSDLLKKEIVLYPNGKMTRAYKGILEQDYKINIKYVIDNNNYNGIDVLNMSQAKNIDNDNTIYLICSEKSEIYNSIRDKIYNTFPLDRIYDLYPPVEFDEYKVEALVREFTKYAESVI